MTYQVTKRYGYNEGWSCAFRQHLADHSHCSFLHGYALAFELTFECEELDLFNWTIDFGGLKGIKDWLKQTFDHRTIVAQDDPHLQTFRELHAVGIINLLVLPAVGCEKFAEHVWGHIFHDFIWQLEGNLDSSAHKLRVTLTSVKVQEHEGNSATYKPS
jgi:6-pyruvoyltetrahydropterin/6-carboxytetrahydropterin synthase